eukprot:3858252-Rhodomonas_salina.2
MPGVLTWGLALPGATKSLFTTCTNDPTGCASCSSSGQQMACYKKDDFFSQAPIRLRACYAMPGTDRAYGAPCQCFKDSTDTAYASGAAESESLLASDAQI